MPLERDPNGAVASEGKTNKDLNSGSCYFCRRRPSRTDLLASLLSQDKKQLFPIEEQKTAYHQSTAGREGDDST